MYVFERVIARFDSLGVLYLSVEERRRNFQNKATEKKGSEEGEGRMYAEEGKGSGKEGGRGVVGEGTGESRGKERGKEVGRGKELVKQGREEFKTKFI